MKEKKVTPKFRTILLTDDLPDDARINELGKWCNVFIKRGLMPPYKGGAYGNLSFRTKENEFVITASGTKAPSSEDCFVTVSNVDPRKRTVNAHGKKLPSSESMLHYMIYRERKDINAVFHGHCKKILKYAGKLGLPVSQKEEAYGTIRLAKGVLKLIDGNDLIIMKGHGFISLGKSMDDAGNLALKVLKYVDRINCKDVRK